MTQYYIGVNASGSSHDTSEVDPNDKWDRASTHTHWSINGIRVSTKDEYGLLPIEIEAGQPVYVVYAIWSSGDSFGHDEDCNCETIDVFKTRKEADDQVEKLKSGGGERRPWDGCFESLTRIDIASGIV